MLYKGFKQDMIATFGEFVGTTMFIFLGLGCVKTAQNSQTFTQSQAQTTLSNPTILFISVGMGLSLLITAWVFYRITGGLFNPAVTLSLYLIGGLKPLRAILLTIAQIAGGIAGSALVEGLTPSNYGNGGIGSAITKLEPGVGIAQGLFLEAFLTAMLVFTVLMLAAEKHKATFMAPIGIGLTLFVCQLFGTLWTGCGMNPARAFGPSVVKGSFVGYHWIYWVGPLIGSLIATFFYSLLKAFDYGSVVLGQDSDNENASPSLPVASRIWHASMGYTRDQRKAMLASGMKPADLERAEAVMVAQAGSGPAHGSDLPSQPGFVAHMGGRHPSRTSESTLNGGASPTMYPVGEKIGSTAGTMPQPKRQKSTRRQSAMGGGADGNISTYNANGNTPSSPTAPAANGGQQTHVQPLGYGPDGEPIPSIMNAQLQDRGGIGAPGAHESGLTNITALRNAVRG